MAGEAFHDLVELMAYLRSPQGCPWDREQDLTSLKALLLEEAYEVVDAIQESDFEAIEDELGDLLFQVVFGARIAEEQGRFDINGVIERIRAKLLRRHPHVFGERKARTAEEALASWRSVKAAESGKRQSAQASAPSALDGMAQALPATLEARELGVRAAEAGFDWANASQVLLKIEEEARELRAVLESSAPEKSRVEEELGDLLFASANLARKSGLDAEVALRAANRKFAKRFRALEAEVARRDKKVHECDVKELDAIWEEIKARTT